MNNRTRLGNIFVNLLLGGILVSALVILLSSRVNLLVSTGAPAASPGLPTSTSPTSTIGNIATSYFIVNETPIPTPKIVDLYPGIPDGDQPQVYVRHSNGLVTIFLIKEGLENNDDLIGIVPFQEGDQVIFWTLPSNSYQNFPTQPPTPIPATSTPIIPVITSTSSPSSTPTPNSYPAR